MFYLFDSTAKPTFSDYFWQPNGGDWWQKLRFDASYIAPSQYGYSQWSISVPNWFLMVICGLPLLLQMGLRIRRTRRRGKGLCPTCGYDLRASTDRCPECGVPIPKELKHEAR